MNTTGTQITVLGFVGSPRRGGNTHILVDEVLRGAQEAGAAVDKVDLTCLEIAPCRGCDTCQETDAFCVHDDDFQSLWEQMKSADAWVLGTPIYWGGPTAQFKAFVDRWYAPEKELIAMPDKHIILVLPLADEGEQAQITVDMMTVALEWISKTLNEVIVAPGVQARGDIRQHSDILKQAYQAGRRAILS
jgi:NAD(P)H-dependent FMN reductase